MTNGFQIGTYTGRLSSGPSGQFTVTVTRVTASFVTIAPTVGQPTTRRRILTNHLTGTQFFFPLGQYSMAPIISLNDFNSKDRTDRTTIMYTFQLIWTTYQNAFTPLYGMCDYPKITDYKIGTVKAETLRKAQNKFKRMYPERNIIFRANSPMMSYRVEQITEEGGK